MLKPRAAFRYNAGVPERERPHSIELAPELVHAFAQTFIPRWDCYPLQLENGKYAQVHERLTMTHIFRHLTTAHTGLKLITIGAYALDEQSQARWMCFDADTDDRWQALRTIASTLIQQQLPVYLETSHRGGHLWLFTPPLSGQDIRQFGQHLLARYNVSAYGADGRKRIELYPKQDVLADGPGSFMRLPLGFHQKSQQVHSFITLEGKPLAPTIRAQIALLGQPQRIPLDFIHELLAQPIELPTPPPRPTPTFRKRRAGRNEPLSETLKHSISVFDFVSRYIALDQHGRGLCPFHNDTVKSFQVNVDHNYWHCYTGCGGGSIIDFWMQWRVKEGQDGSFVETVKDLRAMLLIE
ncbi:MAG: TOTE conflict system archaeo-eukaryotic primase domain-containing protein [Aggregatilineales bacterium]